MDSHTDHQENRDISSSEDRCKCVLCKNQLELQMNNKKPLANIHTYHHLKKRQGPPVKKEANKDSSYKPKNVNKEATATPVKNKADRSKEAYLALVAQQYHMVSHSHRVKLAKEDNQPRREDRMKPKGRMNNENEKQAEISQNPENAKLVVRTTEADERGKIDASPNGARILNQNQQRKFK